MIIKRYSLFVINVRKNIASGLNTKCRDAEIWTTTFVLTVVTGMEQAWKLSTIMRNLIDRMINDKPR